MAFSTSFAAQETSKKDGGGWHDLQLDRFLVWSWSQQKIRRKSPIFES